MELKLFSRGSKQKILFPCNVFDSRSKKPTNVPITQITHTHVICSMIFFLQDARSILKICHDPLIVLIVARAIVLVNENQNELVLSLYMISTLDLVN